MCGITGFLVFSGRAAAALTETARRMADALRHRGPDDAGVWVDADAGLAFAHRRLAILDLSPAGHQPMVSACGRYVIAFNGEIYNHLELRAELERQAGAMLAQGVDCRGPAALAMTTSMPRHCEAAEPTRQSTAFAWRGHSDTETLLAGIAAWGLEATLRRCVGMFAIALWDRQERTLQLARDRFGEKPLYYGWVGGAFLFGSELKALKAYPGFAAPVSREALVQYLRFMYVPAPWSIYEGIYKLEPGCLLTLAGPSADIQIKRWWALADVVQAGLNDPLADEVEALQLLEERLADAVRLQSLADVPLGAFLSGGVDSSAIVALMQQQATRPVKTFTVGFAEAGFDESLHARAVAQHLGTEHHELFVTAPEARAVITGLPHMYDEPFADSSQIPTHLVCRAARQHVTVALSGDAGDELFGGYNRYFWGPRIWNRVSWLPFTLRRGLGGAIRALPAGGWDALSGMAGVSRLGDKIRKLATGLDSVRDMDDLYWSLVSEWTDPGRVVKWNGGKAGSPLAFGPRDDNLRGGSSNDRLPPGLDPVERMMYRDSLTYLPDDILCKVDRAAMACSLETRVPFLDHRVAELAWRLPQSLKIRGNIGKWALRRVLYKHVPSKLIERPKAGFAIPVGQWLRGPLRDWAEALLDETRLAREGCLDPAPIRETWRQHLSGRYDWTPRLWSVLMFQAWVEANKC